MRISVKGRYALAAMTCMAQRYSSGECITVASISGRLGISKIYLEQVFSLLKRACLVTSAKGAQGGYQLARMPWQITAAEILGAVELPLFERTEETVAESAPEIEEAMRTAVFTPLDAACAQALEQVTLQDLASSAQSYLQEQGPMFYI